MMWPSLSNEKRQSLDLHSLGCADAIPSKLKLSPSVSDSSHSVRSDKMLDSRKVYRT